MSPPTEMLDFVEVIFIKSLRVITPINLLSSKTGNARTLYCRIKARALTARSFLETLGAFVKTISLTFMNIFEICEFFR